MVSTAKIGVVVLAAILAGGIGYFVYSNATTNVAEVDVVLGEGSSFFSPTSATVKLGQNVTFVVFNDDSTAHDFGIPAFGNASTGAIQPSATGRVTFVADKAGTFPWYSPLNASYISSAGFDSDTLNGTLTVTG